MRRFKSILAVLNGENDAKLIEKARSLAERNEARVTLVRVVEPLAPRLAFLSPASSDSRLTEALEADARETVDRAVAKMGFGGLSVAGEVLSGVPFIEIVRFALRQGHDLVMKVADPSHPGGARRLASSDLHLLRKCPVPLWVINPRRRTSSSRVLALVDVASEDDDRRHLGEMVLQLGSSLAEMLGGELRIGHAWRLQGEITLRSSGYMRLPPGEVDRLVAEERRKHRGLLEELAARAVPESMPYKLHMAKGDPRRALPRLVARHRPDVIVMGTVGRTGIAGLFIGNTAEEVLMQVTCSVLAVKPEGFVSPVAV